MTDSLLTTKLYRPPVRPELVPRPRLHGRLSAGLQRKLTLVSAPAGFGKTTLLSDWATTCDRPVAWLSLDEADNDPMRFWSYFVAGMQFLGRKAGTQSAGVGEATLAMLRSTRPAPIEAVLTDLINEMAELPAPAILVLDDYHIIRTGRIHEAMTFLVDNLPPHLHLILSTRRDPPWPLARLRARSQISELRATDLRFSRDETAAFLNGAMELDLSTEEIAALDERTEGWIAGLQLAALSLRDRPDTVAAIKEFSGSNRFILDYLVEEVLGRQPQAIQTFLLKTSIVDRLCGDLGDALLGRAETATGSGGGERDPLISDAPASQEILEYLDAANLFLVPLDDERHWYRYHRLFADLLQNRLEQIFPGEMPILHGRASAWYEQNGLIGDAIGHALASGDVERVARLVEGNALATVYHGELASLAGWLIALPEELVRARPWLCVAHAWVLALTGHFDGVEARLQDAEDALMRGQREDGHDRGRTTASTRPDEVDTRHLSGHLLALRAYAAALHADLPTATELARAALDYLPVEDRLARGYVTMLWGSFLRWSGDLVGATETWATISARSRATHDHVDAVFALNALAAVQIQQGQLHGAAATCREALQLAGELVHRDGHTLPFLGVVYARLSTLAREWNDLDVALDHARRAVALSRQWGHSEGLVTTYVALAEALQALGDRAGVEDAMHRATQVATALSDWYGDLLAAQQAQLWMNQGNCAAALQWVQRSGMGVDDDVDFLRHDQYRVFARVAVCCAAGWSSDPAPHSPSMQDVLGLLGRLLSLVEKAGAMGSAIEILLLQALALQVQEQMGPALASLARALALAAPQGYVRTFLDLGAPLAELLQKAAARDISPVYVAALLDAFRQENGKVLDATTPPGRLVAAQLVEPLTDREQEVLRLLPTHLSSTEIADHLIVAPSTVRSHIKSIYAKLDVHSRAEAVARARDLALL